MKLGYTAIYKLHGVARLQDEAKVAALVVLKKPRLSALLTTDPESQFLHIDRSAALAALFKRPVRRDKPGTPEERLAAEIAAVKARRSEQAGEGVFLVLEGEDDIPAPTFKTRRDLKECALCVDDIGER
jgi:hypothetical protein